MLSHEFGLASHVEMWGIRGRVDAVLVVPALAGKTTTGRGWGTYGLFYLALVLLLAEGDQGAGSLGEWMRLDAMAVRFPRVKGHPNRVDFEGVLTLVDLASDRAPAGARGHRVMLTRAAAEAALPSLLGMAVDYRPGWDGHDAKRKIGLITEADLEGKKLMVSGYLYGRDFPEATEAIRTSAPELMGMSYELADAMVADMREEIWRLTKATFTGAAILYREKAAYRATSFRLAS